MRPRRLAPLLFSLALGCGVNVNYVPLNKPPRPMSPRAPESVDLYTTSRPARPHVDVGMIEAQQESAYSQASPAEIVANMRASAAGAGCDGLVLMGGNDTVVGGGSVQSGTGSSWTATLKGYRGTCIVYTREVAAPLAAATPAPPSGSCDPPCSPGYRCEAAACVALCNPPCPSGAVCGSDRVCRHP